MLASEFTDFAEFIENQRLLPLGCFFIAFSDPIKVLSLHLVAHNYTPLELFNVVIKKPSRYGSYDATEASVALI
jgi:hypothetical protein